MRNASSGEVVVHRRRSRCAPTYLAGLRSRPGSPAALEPLESRTFLDASAGTIYLRGGAGSDLINGEAGNDTIRGDAGNDNLAGGDGMDILIGGAGRDRMTGMESGDFDLDEDVLG